jgi:hypothetical protein
MDDLPFASIDSESFQVEDSATIESSSNQPSKLANYLQEYLLLEHVEIPIECITSLSSFRPLTQQGLEDIKQSFQTHPEMQKLSGNEVLVKINEDCPWTIGEDFSLIKCSIIEGSHRLTVLKELGVPTIWVSKLSLHSYFTLTSLSLLLHSHSYFTLTSLSLHSLTLTLTSLSLSLCQSCCMGRTVWFTLTSLSLHSSLTLLSLHSSLTSLSLHSYFTLTLTSLSNLSTC